MGEQSEVQFGRSAIPYAIHRSRRQKTVAIAVDPIEGVSVRAPKATPVERLDTLVHRKARWILDRRRRQEDLPPAPAAREFVSGETFRYLGRQYRLRVVQGRGTGPTAVRLVAGRLQVTIGSEQGSAAAVRMALVAWYRAHAEQRLQERVEVWASLLDVAPREVLIRDQRKRWGSAAPGGGIRLNWRVVQAPMRLVDYVVAHELAHLKHPDHTRAFWATLGRVMGDYEGRREALRRLGASMVW